MICFQKIGFIKRGEKNMGIYIIKDKKVDIKTGIAVWKEPFLS